MLLSLNACDEARLSKKSDAAAGCEAEAETRGREVGAQEELKRVQAIRRAYAQADHSTTRQLGMMGERGCEARHGQLGFLDHAQANNLRF